MSKLRTFFTSSQTQFAIVATLAALAACSPTTPQFAFRHAEQRGVLEKNGLKFVIMPDPTTQLVEVDMRYDVGAREDPIGKAGLAHVVEHMMFQLRPDAGLPPLMQQLNQLSTFFNAYTNSDTTHYQTTARVDKLNDMLEIEAERLYFGCKTISNDQFLREREVVRNEIRQRGGTAEGQIPQLIMDSVYPAGHAYSREVGGNDAQLTTITLDDACKFIHDYYVPSRATLIIAGGVDIDPTVTAIQKWFGKLDKRDGAPRFPVKQFEIDNTRKTFELDVERPSVHVAWALPPANTPEGEAAQFGIGAAFFGAAEKAQEYDFATSVSPNILGGELAPVFAIDIDLKSIDRLDEALEFVRNAAAQAYRGFDEGSYEELEEQKNRNKADFILGIEPLSARTNQMGDLVQFSTDFDFNSKDLYFIHQIEKIEKYDGEAVSKAVKKALDPNKARIIVIKATKAGSHGDKRSAITFQTKSDDKMELAEVDPREAKRPIKVAGELKALDGAQRFQLGNGMNVVLLPIHAMPIITAELRFNAGAASSPKNPALASAAARFLHLPMDAEAMQRTGVNVGCRAAPDSTVCETGGVSIYLDVMLKGLERLITAGEYNQQQIEAWQKNTKTHDETQSAQSELEFNRQFLSAIYGADHPYTVTGVMTPNAASKVGRDDLNSFRHEHYTAGNATLIISGDFDPAAATAKIKDIFGGWSKGTIDQPVATTPFQRTGPAFIGVIGKEAPQMEVRMAYPSPAGIDGQEAARQVLTEMLNIRMGDIRFKLGATYGTYAGRDRRRGPSAYMMGGTVDAPRAGEALKAMRDGVNMLRCDKDCTDQFSIDFVRARRKVLTDLLGLSTVTSELAARLGSMAAFGLSPDYYNKLLQQVAAVSPAQVKLLIKSELDPNTEVVVAEEDRPTLTKAFADAGITDVKLIEPEYKQTKK